MFEREAQGVDISLILSGVLDLTTYLRRPMAVARPTAAVAPIRVQFSIEVTVSVMLSRAKWKVMETK